MSFRLEASGTRRITPTSADEDGIVTAILPSDSAVVLEGYQASGDIVLSTDDPVEVPLGPALGGGFTYVLVRVKGGRVNATLTSTLDASAVLPVEPRLELRSDNLPFSGLVLQRQVGVEVVCNVYLGKRS